MQLDLLRLVMPTCMFNNWLEGSIKSIYRNYIGAVLLGDLKVGIVLYSIS